MSEKAEKKPEPKLISADTSLKDQIGKGVNLRNIFTEDRIQAGQAAIEEVKDEFVVETTQKLDELIEMGRNDPSSEEAKKLFIETAFTHKGKAESLGYKMLALTLASLEEYSEQYLPGDKHAKVIVGKHTDILEIILRDKVMGDGDKIGNELLAALPELIAHFHPSEEK